MRDDSAFGGVGDDRDATGTGAMTGEKSRQHVERDIGGGAADERAVLDDRISHDNDRIAGIRIERRFVYYEGACVLRSLVPPQSPDIHDLLDIVTADHMRPCIEERAIADPSRGARKAVDVAGMPVRRRWNLRVGPPAVVVDAGHDAVIAVLEADIGRIDLPRRGERLVEQISALFLFESVRVLCGD